MRISTRSKRNGSKLHFLSISLGFLLASHALIAVQIGDSREAVLKEKGSPMGRMEAASVELLKYADQTIRLRDGKVVGIEPVALASSPSTETEAEYLEAEVLARQRSRPIVFRSGTLVELGSTLVYLPPGIEAGKKYPLVFALSPNADALGMIGTWASVADKRRWIVAASTDCKNGMNFTTLLAKMEAGLAEVESSYPTDHDRVIFTGFSGGGMAAHAFAKFHPARVRAVVVNSGMIQPSFATHDYPQGKMAVFLASPTDYRYAEMKTDRAFLEQRGWKTRWIEFAGGHVIAPPDIYDRAAALVSEALK